MKLQRQNQPGFVANLMCGVTSVIVVQVSVEERNASPLGQEPRVGGCWSGRARQWIPLLSWKCLQHTQVGRFRKQLDLGTQNLSSGSELEMPLWDPSGRRGGSAHVAPGHLYLGSWLGSPSPDFFRTPTSGNKRPGVESPHCYGNLKG